MISLEEWAEHHGTRERPQRFFTQLVNGKIARGHSWVDGAHYRAVVKAKRLQKASNHPDQEIRPRGKLRVSDPDPRGT